MDYVNKCCDDGLKKNFLSRSFSSNGGGAAKTAEGSAFSKSKKIKVSY